MERVVTINLNGNPYQLEEPAYDAVRAYLAHAEASLADNPDKAEILRDLEQAIADKCAAYLSPVKTVVTAAEMTKALEEMGPVEGEGARSAGASGSASSAAGASPRKRIYRIRDGAQIAGVCAGVAAYFDLDVNIVRLLFIIMTIITSGGFLLVYIAMMFLIPSAHTSEEWAAAHGVPFNAQEVIDRAKREYAHFTENGPPWQWSRWQRRQWKRDMRARWRGWSSGYGWNGGYGPAAAAAPAGPVTYAGRVIGGFFAIIFGFIRAILAIVFIAFLFTLVTTGSLGYWALPPHVEIWQALVALIIIYAVITVPLRALTHMAYGGPYWGYRRADGFVTLVFFALAAWFAWTYVPEARHIMENLPDALVQFGEGLRNTLNNAAQPLIN